MLLYSQYKSISSQYKSISFILLNIGRFEDQVPALVAGWEVCSYRVYLISFMAKFVKRKKNSYFDDSRSILYHITLML